MKPLTCGDPNSYRHGCRCHPCRFAYAGYRKEAHNPRLPGKREAQGLLQQMRQIIQKELVE